MKTKTIEAKAAYADGRGKCGLDCLLFYECKPLARDITFGRKIYDLCRAKFREGYRKGYNQCKRDNSNGEKGK